MTLTRVFADAEDLAARAAEIFAETIAAALHDRGRAAVVLAGGSTPRAACERLAVLVAGERLPLDAPERTIHSRQPARGDPADCAARFAARLARGPFPAGADLAILGIGADGHTASLFPGADALLPGGREEPVGPDLRADAVAVRLSSRVRLTLTPKWLGMARCVAFLAAGPGPDATGRDVRYA